MKSSFYFILFLSVLGVSNFSSSLGQNPKTIDSLKIILKSSIEDTSKFTLLIDLASEHLKIDANASVKYSIEALELAKKLNFDDGFSRGNGMLGVAYTNLGKFNEAVKALEEGLNYAIKIKDKAAQARIYNSLANVNYYQSDFDKSLLNHQHSLKLKKELGDMKGVAYSYNNISYNYYAQGKYAEMIAIATKALNILEEEKDSAFIAETFNSIGAGYFGMGNYPEAMKNFFKSINIREKRGDKHGAAACYLNIGSIYQNQKNYPGSIKYFNQALKIYEEVGDSNNIGTIYYSLGTTYMYEGNYSEALKYNLLALEMKKKTGDKSVLALTYSNIGEVYYLLGQYQKSLDYHFEGLKIKNDIGEKQSIAMSLTGIGKVYTKLKNFKESKINLDEALKISIDIGSKEVQKTTYEALTELYEAQYDFKTALINYKLFSVAKDSLINDDNNKRIAELNTKFETEKKNNENVILKQDNLIKDKQNQQQQQTRNIVLIASCLIISLLIFGFYNFYNRRKISFTRTVERVNNKALRSQMNPHFMFNALQSIQSFLMVNNSQDANTYLIKFSKLMRLVLENSQHQEVSIAEDKEALELYMQLEGIRLKHPFKYNFKVDEGIDVNSTMIPPLILQPFVENAIWHGLQYKEGPGRININITKKGEELHCTVEDDGIGRDLSKKVEKPMLLKKESLGMKLTEERLKIINELKKFKSEFRIVDLTSADNKPNGTRVELSIPLS
jgi:tetratricopeptide (TPR) repeat protein